MTEETLAPAEASISTACLASASRPRTSFAEALANPAACYPSPHALVSDPDLWPDEKRAMLLSWMRDALAIEQLGTGGFDETASETRADAVLDALAQIDPHAAAEFQAALDAIRGERRRRALYRRRQR